ncbi:hypothetical protein GCM10014715_39840 [Streptomyces spiralis]|uniref:Uncharacterized protein n=1 Tax=Streptomyces spiralis TaxID=66376 RepID=A0A919A1C2_9ACTN|nr:hypothetical protein GCM10014715_39840 [Streptomyces spiralis]
MATTVKFFIVVAAVKAPDAAALRRGLPAGWIQGVRQAPISRHHDEHRDRAHCLKRGVARPAATRCHDPALEHPEDQPLYRNALSKGLGSHFGASLEDDSPHVVL